MPRRSEHIGPSPGARRVPQIEEIAGIALHRSIPIEGFFVLSPGGERVYRASQELLPEVPHVFKFSLNLSMPEIGGLAREHRAIRSGGPDSTQIGIALATIIREVVDYQKGELVPMLHAIARDADLIISCVTLRGQTESHRFGEIDSRSYLKISLFVDTASPDREHLAHQIRRINSIVDFLMRDGLRVAEPWIEHIFGSPQGSTDPMAQLEADLVAAYEARTEREIAEFLSRSNLPARTLTGVSDIQTALRERGILPLPSQLPNDCPPFEDRMTTVDLRFLIDRSYFLQKLPGRDQESPESIVLSLDEDLLKHGLGESVIARVVPLSQISRRITRRFDSEQPVLHLRVCFNSSVDTPELSVERSQIFGEIANVLDWYRGILAPPQR